MCELTAFRNGTTTRITLNPGYFQCVEILVAELCRHAKRRIFARNVRGFLGTSTPVNRQMSITLKKEPERFFYFNNGITFLCDRVRKTSENGRDVLIVGNPQIINGQQTTRTLAEHPDEAAKASVLVKVIRVTDTQGHALNGFDRLLTEIVAGTNRQTPIRPTDLMANDRIQIDLERGAAKKWLHLYS